MKRLALLTFVLMLTAGATGCQCCNWLRRGAPNPYPQAVTYGGVCDPCDPCATAPVIPPVLSPGAPSYAPGPG